MDTIFMNSENSRTSEYHVLVLKLADRLDLGRGQKVLLYQILVCTKHGETQKAHTIIIDHGSYSISDIQDYFEYILKKQ